MLNGTCEQELGLHRPRVPCRWPRSHFPPRARDVLLASQRPMAFELPEVRGIGEMCEGHYTFVSTEEEQLVVKISPVTDAYRLESSSSGLCGTCSGRQLSLSRLQAAFPACVGRTTAYDKRDSPSRHCPFPPEFSFSSVRHVPMPTGRDLQRIQLYKRRCNRLLLYGVALLPSHTRSPSHSTDVPHGSPFPFPATLRRNPDEIGLGDRFSAHGINRIVQVQVLEVNPIRFAHRCQALQPTDTFSAIP